MGSFSCPHCGQVHSADGDVQDVNDSPHATPGGVSWENMVCGECGEDFSVKIL